MNPDTGHRKHKTTTTKNALKNILRTYQNIGMNFLEFILQNVLTSKKFAQMQLLRNSSILKYFIKNFKNCVYLTLPQMHRGAF